MPPAEDRDRLIEAHLPWARRVALGIVRHVPQLDTDAVADAWLGLVKAAQRYDAQAGVPFEAFALRYVRGSVVDGLRAAGLMSRREVRAHRRGAGVPFRSLVSLTPQAHAAALVALPDVAAFERVADARALLRRATLSASHRHTLARLLRGASRRVIAVEDGVTVHAVGHRVTAIARACQAAMRAAHGA